MGASHPKTSKTSATEDFWDSLHPCCKEEVAYEMYLYIFDTPHQCSCGSTFFVNDLSNELIKNTFVCIIKNHSLEKIILRLCVLGELFYNIEKFLTAFTGAIVKTLLTHHESYQIDQKELQPVFKYVINLCDYTQLSLIKRKQIMENEIGVFASSTHNQSPLKNSSNPIELFHIFWSEQLKDPNFLSGLGQKVCDVLFSSKQCFRQLFPTYGHFAETMMGPIFTLFDREKVNEFSSHYDNIISLHKHMYLKQEHFVQFGQALILALKSQLGSNFSAQKVQVVIHMFNRVAQPIQMDLEHSFIEWERQTKLRKLQLQIEMNVYTSTPALDSYDIGNVIDFD